MSDDEGAPVETIEQLRKSFRYGSRSNMNFKFLDDLTDREFGDFIEELLDAVATATDTGRSEPVVDVAFRWQVRAYAAHLGDPTEFRYRYDDVPLARLAGPLSESRLLLLTSSGHFVEGDDPEPFGVENMTQAEAERRIGEFTKSDPTLSAIPIDTEPGRLRVRHGGYPVQAAAADNEVVLPLAALRELVTDGVIGELVENAYSFVGATSQGRLRRTHAPEWAAMARGMEADAALLVPI